MSTAGAKSGRKGPRAKKSGDPDAMIDIMRWAVERRDELHALRDDKRADAIVEAELSALVDALAGVRVDSVVSLRRRVVQDELAPDAVRAVERHLNGWKQPRPAARNTNDVLWPETVLSDLQSEAALLRGLLERRKHSSRKHEDIGSGETKRRLLHVEATIAQVTEHNARVRSMPPAKRASRIHRRALDVEPNELEYSRIADALLPIAQSIGASAFKRAALVARTSEEAWLAWQGIVQNLLESEPVRVARDPASAARRARPVPDFRSGVRHAAETAVAKLIGYADAKSVRNAIERAGRAPHAYSRPGDDDARRATAARKRIEFQQRIDGQRLARARTELDIEQLAEHDYAHPLKGEPNPSNVLELDGAKIAAGGEGALVEALRFKYGLTCRDGLTGNLRLVAEMALKDIRQREPSAAPPNS